MTMAGETGRPAARIGLAARLGVAAAAAGLALVLCEVAARVVFQAPPDVTREPQIAYQSTRETGFLHVPGQEGWLDDGLATINAIGLRGPMPAVPKPEGTYRVLAIGDSTTFGWGVGDDETYPAQLERLLKEQGGEGAVDVINGGVVAYDLRNAARLLRHFGPALEPDLVLVGLFWNDLPYEDVTPTGEVLRARAASARPAALDAPGWVPKAPLVVPEARSKPYHIGNQPSRINRLLRSSRMLYVMRQAWLSAIAPTAAATNQVQWEMALLEGRESPAIDEAWAAIGRTLAEIRAMGDAGGFDVGVVVVPIRAQVEGNHPSAAYQTRVKALADDLGLLFVDPLPALVAHRDETLFIPYDRMHLSAEGNRRMAEAAHEGLRAWPAPRAEARGLRLSRMREREE